MSESNQATVAKVVVRIGAAVVVIIALVVRHYGSKPRTVPAQAPGAGPFQPAADPRPLARVAPAMDDELRRSLVGTWRQTAHGTSSTWNFFADGTCAMYVSADNPFINTLFAEAGDVYGNWGIRDGLLTVEFRGGKSRVLDGMFRGRLAQGPCHFTDRNAVTLSGIELDAVARTYVRIR